MASNARRLLLIAVALSLSACVSGATRKQRYYDQGQAYAAKGDYRQAIIEYRKAVQVDEKYGEARFALAQAYQKIGDMAQALREVIRAADLLPDNTAAQLRAGNFLVLVGGFEDAATRARNVLEREPSNVDALILLGNASAGLKDSDGAMATLQQAVKQLPAEPRLQESLGSLQVRRGNTEGAETAFKRAVDLAPKSVEAREALATYYWTAGRSAEAEQTLKEALLVDASGFTVDRDLAIFYFMEGRDNEAELHLLRAVERQPDEQPLRVALGDLYVRERQFDKALATYEPLLKDPGNLGPATARKAYALYSAGRTDAAYAALNAALKKAAKDSDLHTMIARFQLADRKFSSADASARAALAVTPERFQALYVLGAALLEQGRPDEAIPVLQHAVTASPYAVGPKLQLGQIYYNRGDLKTALPIARDAVALDPGQPLARVLLTRVLIAQRDGAEAAKALEPLLKTAPNSADVQAAAGDIATLKGDRDGAQKAYTRALSLNPVQPEALNGLLMVRLASGKAGEATALAKASVDAHPNDVRVLLAAARTYLATGDAKQGEALLQKVIQASPSSMDAYELLASLYFTQRRLDQAKSEFEIMAKQQPSAPGAATMIGIILQLQGKQSEARDVYSRLLETVPDAPVAANNLAMLLVQFNGNLDVALNHAQTAKKAMPNDPDVNDTLGLVYLKKGLWSLAAVSFESCTQARPNSAEFWLHLGQAYAGSGNKTKARDALEKALKLDPKGAGADEARKAIEGLTRKSA